MVAIVQEIQQNTQTFGID
ncbi:hypothetical protein D047_1279A, partial [Vibrio parahaemolyticus VPTS-2010_2]